MTKEFDTLETSKELQRCGLETTAAEGISQAINGALIANAVTKDEHEKLGLRVDMLDDRFKILEGKIDSLPTKDEDEKLRASIDARFDVQDGKIDSLATKVERLSSSVDARFDVQDGKIELLAAKVDALKDTTESNIAALTTKFDALKDTTESNISGLATKFDALKTTVKSDIDKLITDNQSLKNYFNWRIVAAQLVSAGVIISVLLTVLFKFFP